MTDSVVEEAERYLKSLQSGEIIVSEQGAHSLVKVTTITTENGKRRSGDFTEQYGTWLLEMRTYYESMRNFNTISTISAKSEAARMFVKAYRHGETFRLFEVGELTRLKEQNAKLTKTLEDTRSILTRLEIDNERQGRRIISLEKILTENNIDFGSLSSVAP